MLKGIMGRLVVVAAVLYLTVASFTVLELLYGLCFTMNINQKNLDNKSPDIEVLFHSPYLRQHISQLLKKHSTME